MAVEGCVTTAIMMMQVSIIIKQEASASAAGPPAKLRWAPAGIVSADAALRAVMVFPGCCKTEALQPTQYLLDPLRANDVEWNVREG
jgi:hypothetical protein